MTLFGQELFKNTSKLRISWQAKPFTVGSELFSNIGIVRRVDSPLGRKYVTPEGHSYPSVTTILESGDHDGDWLEQWKHSVGEAASDYSERGLRRGTALHEYMETYVGGETDHIQFNNLRSLQAFTAAKSAINKNVTHVHAQEAFLYSDKLRVAGACDMVAQWRGQLSIIDFKGSSNIKYAEEILGYWLQVTAYSLMVYERTGMMCKNLVIIMANVDDPIPVIHIRKLDNDLINRFLDVRDVYTMRKE
jgi:CRISPR/Cas system-associated exonuclease Cas4 (RecB family)